MPMAEQVQRLRTVPFDSTSKKNIRVAACFSGSRNPVSVEA